MQPNIAREIRYLNARLAEIQAEQPKNQYEAQSKVILIEVFKSDLRRIKRMAHKGA
jgi:hypothetical protein